MTVARMRAVLESSDAWRRWLGHPGFDDVPVAPFSPALVSKRCLDGLLRAWFARSAPDFWLQPQGAAPDAARELAAILDLYGDRGWLERPRAFHRDPPALERVRIASGRRGHHRFEHLVFSSGYEPDVEDPVRERWCGYAANRLAHAWLLRHTRQESRPWLICLHGIGMGTPWTDFPAFRRDHVYETLGFNVLWYVKPFHGPRARGTSSHETFRRGLGNWIHAQAQSMWDLRRILGWIGRQHEASVGVYGLSLGGHAAALLSCLDEGLDLVVAGVPGTDLVDLLQRSLPAPEPGRPDPLAVFWRDARRALRVVSPLAMPPRLVRSRRFLFAGLVDLFTPPASVRRLWLHWERPRIAWYPGSHTSFLFESEVRGLLDEAFACLAAGPARA